MQSEDPVPRNLVMGVVEQTGGRDEVLHMRGFEEAETTVFPKGNLSDSEFNFYEVTVVTGSHEHCLLAKLDSRLVGLKNALDDRPRFRRGVVAAVEARR